jgi:hypothetical protein
VDGEGRSGERRHGNQQGGKAPHVVEVEVADEKVANALERNLGGF